MRIPTTFFTVSLLAAPMTAQQLNPIAYPQATTTGTWNNGQAFGVASTGSNDETRNHILVPATHLPSTGGLVRAIEVVPARSNPPNVFYRRLEINLAHRPAGAGPLSEFFAANLPNGSQNVLNAANLSVQYTGYEWNRIDFTTPFAYDGQSDLLIEVKKETNTSPTSLGFYRNNDFLRTGGSLPAPRGLERMVFAFGPSGSGKANATMADLTQRPLRVRLIFEDAPTMTVTSPVSAFQTHFGLGTTVDIDVHGPAGSFYVTLVAVAPGPMVALPVAPLNLPLVQGSWWVQGASMPTGFVLPGQTAGNQVFPIPADPMFFNTHIALQTAFIPVGGTWSWTNVCDFVVNA